MSKKDSIDRSLNSIKYKIYSELRKIWSRYDPNKKMVKELSKIKIPVMKKDGILSKKYTVLYKCSECGYPKPKIHVHHIKPVGNIFNWPLNGEGQMDKWLISLFCPPNNLRVVCEDCHKLIHKGK